MPLKHQRKRQDATIEAEGAEFLVLGHLLLAGITAFKAYVNFAGYDLIATNAKTKRTAHIQDVSMIDWSDRSRASPGWRNIRNLGPPIDIAEASDHVEPSAIAAPGRTRAVLVPPRPELP